MRIPFWQKEQAHPTKAIDRLQDNRSLRRVIGLWTAPDFSTVSAALVQVKGCSKFARFQELAWDEISLEDSAQQTMLELKAEANPSETEIQFVSAELSAYQSNCCRNLIAKAGVHAADIVALGVMDPGLQLLDFEGKPCFRSLTNAAELASRTSISVIDRFPERDIVDGGNGCHLFALGYWFLMGDRNPRIADENRMLVLCENDLTEVFFLPASDGLDAVLPRIELTQFERNGNEIDLPQIGRLAQKYLNSDPNLKLLVITQTESPLDLELDSRIEIMALESLGITKLEAVASAFLANAFVDQLPVSIPELTGNPNPRVLGSLTPGSLVNFRNFVLQTSKVSPSIMKLRDAI